MSAYYTVVQYVPDPLTDERVNVGVIAFSGDDVRARFVRDWRRVRQFGGEDISFLRDLAKRAHEWTGRELQLPGLGESVRLDEDGVRDIAGRWINTVRFTEPRGSLLEAEELLEDMAVRYLRHPRKKRAFRDRRSAATLVRTRIEAALERTATDSWKTLLKKNHMLRGKLDEHKFDVVAEDAHLFFAAQGLSFEGPVTREQEREIAETAWALDDVRAQFPRVPLSVVALPPKTGSKTYNRARHVFDGLGAKVVTEDEVEDWAAETAGLVARSFL